jgi:RNA polymerase sigma-70 factor (ECF subfamily)
MLPHTDLSARLPKLNPDEFGQVVEPFRRELRVHCYRMLGSVQEAEEMVQETFLRAWSRRDTYAGRASLRAWLYKIATNLSIDAIRRKPRRALPITRDPVSTPEQPVPASIDEPIWLEPYPADTTAPAEASPEARYVWDESIRMAFLAALHWLPPYQRAVLILRDVLDWPASEVAEIMGQSLPSVKSALYRARKTLAQRYSGQQPETMATDASDEETRHVLEQYLRAWEAADVEGLLALLREDCTFSMPPIPSWYRGWASIGKLVARTVFGGQARARWRLLPTTANAQPAFGIYKRNEASEVYDGYGIQVITLTGAQISDIITFRNPALIAFFDLPPVLAA